MIIEPNPELGGKDIEAARSLNQPQQSSHAGPSTSAAQTAPVQADIEALPGVIPGNYPDVVFPGPQEPLGPPPAFAPYEAEWFEVGHGDVVSHDEHLNTDGEALYRFLLTQASQRPPSYRIHCKGSHIETRYRWINTYGVPSDFGHNHGHNQNHYGHSHGHPGGTPIRTESYTERVTDFNFYIDVTPPFSSPYATTIPSPPPAPADSKTRTDQPGGDEDANPRDNLSPIHWSVADNEPVYRGKMVREVELMSSTSSGTNRPGADTAAVPLLPSISPTTTTHRRKVTRRECKDYSEWIKRRTHSGLPPWVSGSGYGPDGWSVPTYPTSRDVLKSSKTVRQWADEYCSSPKLLKEFVYTKVLYGWDIGQLGDAIRSTIALSPYHGEIDVSFVPINSKVYIRSSNKLSRALSNGWIKFLSIILFIFPFIWLFKRFHSKGGGRWEVCGGAYALKRWTPLNTTTTTTTGPTTGHHGPSSSGGSELPSYDDIAGPSTFASGSSSSPLSTSAASPSFPFPSSSTSMGPTTLTSPQPRILQTPQGPHKLIGQREGEWFRHWEPVILRAVLTRYQSTAPLTAHSELYGRYAAPGSALEGYHDAPAPVGMPVPIILQASPAAGYGHGRSGHIFLP